jgi:hypothetical protein
MAQEGVDYSFTRPNVRALYIAGKRFAVRYHSRDTSGKNLTHSEAVALCGAGLSIVSNWEHGERAALLRFTQGAADAREAKAQAERCGKPNGAPIYFSVDWDVQPHELEAVRSYFTGAASVLGIGQVGIYGGLAVVAAAINQGWCHWFWQTYAWSHGRVHPGVDIYQYQNGVDMAGGKVDLDRAYPAYFGQWTLEEHVTDVALTEAQDGALGVAYQAGHALIHGETHTVGAGTDGGGTPVFVTSTLQAIVDDIGALTTKVGEVSVPAVNTADLAHALISDPTFIPTLADAIASKIVTRGGSISLTGSMTGSFTPTE